MFIFSKVKNTNKILLSFLKIKGHNVTYPLIFLTIFYLKILRTFWQNFNIEKIFCTCVIQNFFLSKNNLIYAWECYYLIQKLKSVETNILLLPKSFCCHLLKNEKEDGVVFFVIYSFTLILLLMVF